MAYSLEQLQEMLTKASEAGNRTHVAIISGEIQKLQAQDRPRTTAGGMIGAATRQLALPAATTAAGATAGSVVPGVGTLAGAGAGFTAGVGAQLVADPLVNLTNYLFGTNIGSPTEALNKMLTEFGVEEPDTVAEQLAGTAASAATGVPPTLQAGKALMGAQGAARAQAGMAPTTARESIGRALADSPTAQLASAATGAVAAETAAEMGGGAGLQLAAGLAGGLAGGAPFMRPRTPSPRLAPDEPAPPSLADDAPAPAVRAAEEDVIPPPTTRDAPKAVVLSEEGQDIIINAARGNSRAQQSLANLAKTNLEAKQASVELGISVPEDVLSDSAEIITAAGIARSKTGTDIKNEFYEDIKLASTKADDLMTNLGASEDISEVSGSVYKELSDIERDLVQKSSKIYDKINEQVPEQTVVDAPNLKKLLQEEYNRFITADPETDMNPGLLSLYKRFFGSEKQEAKPVSISTLFSLKSQIGNKWSKSDPNGFSSITGRELGLVYQAIKNDYREAISRFAGDDFLDDLTLADEMVVRKKSVQDDIANLFGSDKNGSIASKLTRIGTEGAQKGDTSDITRLLNAVQSPEKKSQVLASSLLKMSKDSEGNFSFKNFADSWDKIKSQSEVYKIYIQNFTPSQMNTLNKLSILSRRIANSQEAIEKTGRENVQVLKARSLETQGLFSVFFNSVGGRTAARAGAFAAGTAGGGWLFGTLALGAFNVLAARSRKQTVDLVGEMFASQPFQNMMTKVIETGAVPQEQIDALASNSTFKKWSKLNGIRDPRAFIVSAIAAAKQGPEEEESEDQPPRGLTVSLPTQGGSGMRGGQPIQGQ
jgi:hypothetical protein